MTSYYLLFVNILLKCEIYREKYTHPKCTARCVFTREAYHVTTTKSGNTTSPPEVLPALL